MKKISLPTHQDTTKHARVLYPAQIQSGFPPIGIVIGKNVMSGEVATLDPWAWYTAQITTSPAVFIMGEIGKGKSAFVKSFILRSVDVFNRRAWIIDPKGEYDALAKALGIPTLNLGAVNSSGRLAALAPIEGEDSIDLARRRSQLVTALATAAIGRELNSREEAALDTCVLGLSEIAALHDLTEALLNPSKNFAEQMATTQSLLAEEIRDVALGLRRFTSGRLSGMLDASPLDPDAIRLDPSAPGLHVNLASVYRDKSILAPVMIAAVSWITPQLALGDSQSHLVIDEAWQILNDQPGLVTWLSATLKLSRSLGVSLTMVVHRISDLRSAGDDTSIVAKRAVGLLEDTQIRVLFASSAGEVEIIKSTMGLSDEDVDWLSHLPRGRCLVICGDRRGLFDVILTQRERSITDTDQAMRKATTESTKI